MRIIILFPSVLLPFYFQTAKLLADETPLAVERSNRITESLTLQRAITLALKQNPSLQATAHEYEAKKSEISQSRQRNNPELEFALEEIAGSGKRKSLDAAESSITISQPIRLGKKRQRTIAVSKAFADVTRYELTSKRQDVVAEVTKAFIDVLAAQERVDLHIELMKLAEETLKTVETRVEVGKVAPLEGVKSKVAFSTAKLRMERSKKDLTVAKHQLASLWGAPQPLFAEVTGDLEALPVTPSLQELLNRLFLNPDIEGAGSEIRHEQSIFQLEKSRRIPDIEVKGGIQHFSESNDASFTFGISLPIKVFDRNRGNIKAAASRVSAAEQNYNAIRVEYRARLNERYQEYSGLHASVKTMAEEILPAANLAFNAATEGYREGKFGFMDVLDAQRTLFQSKVEYVELLASYHKKAADLAQLAGLHQEQENAKEDNHD